jgi:hypothetical protein
MIFAVSTSESVRVWIDAGATVVIAAIAGIYTLLRNRRDGVAAVLALLAEQGSGEIAAARQIVGKHFEPPDPPKSVRSELSTPSDETFPVLDSLYTVLWYFNRVVAFREHGCTREGRRLLDASIVPLVRTYCNYFGPDLENPKVWEKPKVTAGNGHEGLFELAACNHVTCRTNRLRVDAPMAMYR